MDNREFAQVLLCEATELLEDAGARYNDRKIEKLRSEYAKDKKRVEHGKDPSILNKYKDAGKTRITKIRDGKYGGDFVDINPVTNDKDYADYKNARKGRADIDSGWSSSYVTTEYRGNATVRNPKEEDGSYERIEPYYKSALKKAGLTDKDKYSRDEKVQAKYDKALKDARKQYDLDRKINEKGKKPQNESIAILLTEAALLLNESVFSKINEKTFATKKETDDIVKYYTSIEGLHTYASKKDAIIEFTKIKQNLNSDGSFDFTIKKINDANVMYAFGKDAQEDMVIFVYIAVIDKKENIKVLERTPGQLRKIIKRKSK